MRVQPAGLLGVMSLLNHQFHNGARRRVDRKTRKTDDLFHKFEGRLHALVRPRRGRQLPGAVALRYGDRLARHDERIGHAHVEPVGGIAFPLHASAVREGLGGDHRLPAERDLPHAERTGLRGHPIHAVPTPMPVAAAGGRLVRRTRDLPAATQRSSGAKPRRSSRADTAARRIALAWREGTSVCTGRVGGPDPATPARFRR